MGQVCMEALNQDFIITIISQLGIGGIFAYLFIKKDEKKEQREKELTDDKDALVQKLMESYNENTRVQEGLRQALKSNTEVIKENKSLTEQVFLQLIKHDSA